MVTTWGLWSPRLPVCQSHRSERAGSDNWQTLAMRLQCTARCITALKLHNMTPTIKIDFKLDQRNCKSLLLIQKKPSKHRKWQKSPPPNVSLKSIIKSDNALAYLDIKHRAISKNEYFAKCWNLNLFILNNIIPSADPTQPLVSTRGHLAPDPAHWHPQPHCHQIEMLNPQRIKRNPHSKIQCSDPAAGQSEILNHKCLFRC